jgi:phenylacetate-CoA ligase
MTPNILSDTDRFPTLTPAGRDVLRFMREHPHAPIYRNESGNRLSADEVEQVRALEREALGAAIGWQPNQPPAWMKGFVARCIERVPAYRRYGTPPASFTDLPTIDRSDLARDIAQYVPDDVEVDRLINFRTSGTTGHPLLVASHPLVAAQYLGYHKRALRRFGIELQHGRGQVGVVLIGTQSACFTYVSVTPTMGESGLAKLNLHPSDWRHPDDRARYIDALAPEVIAGDPISFAELEQLGITTRPRALLSTSMALSPLLRRRFEAAFGCPVLDLYSLNEAGPVGVAIESAGGHVLLQHRMYVEILDTEGRPVSAGKPGEVTLTGGFNSCLPLLRYRTGDYAALERCAADLVLTGLSGRPPVRYRTMSGEWINNIEITHALRRLPLVQYALHQDAAGDLRFIFQGAGVTAESISSTLAAIFGPNQRMTVRGPVEFDAKVVQYTSGLPGSEP